LYLGKDYFNIKDPQDAASAQIGSQKSADEAEAKSAISLGSYDSLNYQRKKSNNDSLEDSIANTHTNYPVTAKQSYRE